MMSLEIDLTLNQKRLYVDNLQCRLCMPTAQSYFFTHGINVECLYNTDLRIYINNTSIDEIVSCLWVIETHIKQKWVYRQLTMSFILCFLEYTT